MRARVLLLAALAACEGGDPCREAGAVCTVIGTGSAGLGDPGAPGADTLLYLPVDVTVGPDQRLYVADWNNHRVVAMAEGGPVELIAGVSRPGVAVDGPASELELNHPTGIAFGEDASEVVLAAWANSKVVGVDLEAGEARVVAGTGLRDYVGDGGSAVQAILNLPVAVGRDSRGRTYVLDQFNQRVRRIDGDGVITTVLGPPDSFLPYPGDGLEWMCPPDPSWSTCVVCAAGGDDCQQEKPWARGFLGDGLAPERAVLSLATGEEPSGRFVMQGDVMYLVDSGNHRVRAIDWSADEPVVRTVAGSGGQECDPAAVVCVPLPGEYAGDGGPADAARLDRPSDVAIAEDGSMFIADMGSSCVRRVSPDGIIDTIAGVCGSHGYSGDGGPARDALFDHPFGVALAPDGALHVADTNNHRVRRIQPY